jgi:hypothetical protein
MARTTSTTSRSSQSARGTVARRPTHPPRQTAGHGQVLAGRSYGTTVTGQRAALHQPARERAHEPVTGPLRGADNEGVGPHLLRQSPQLGQGISPDDQELGVDASLSRKALHLLAQACANLLAHLRHYRRGGIVARAPGDTT